MSRPASGTLALSFITALTLLFGFGAAAAQGQVATAQARPGGAGALFGRGINFGNALEAPQEGWWGLTLEESYVAAVADAGFQTVRLPIKWSGHAAEAAPYTIDPAFLARVDEVVGWILAHGLNVIVDFHHYDEMAHAPNEHAERWLGIWRQVAEHYHDAPDALAFELLNEPNQALDAALWNELLARALAVVRESNPARWVVIGPVDWNSLGALDALAWPRDERVVVTVHYYDPFGFTHQGADWVDAAPPVGRVWTGDQLSPAAGWGDWSWDTLVEYGSALTLTYQAGWAGYYLQPSQPAMGFEALALTTSRDVDLLVSCGEGESKALHASARVQQVLALEDCGGAHGVTRLFVQNATDSPQPAFELSGLELRGPAGALPLTVSESQAVEAALDLVTAWTRDNGDPPVLLGEFGAFKRADSASRARWTAVVRRAAEARGFSWTYWEFGAGFGAFDPEARAWREPLREALLGD